MSKEPMSKIKKIIILLSSLFLVSIAALYYLNKKQIVNLNNITSYWLANNTKNTNEQTNVEQNDNKKKLNLLKKNKLQWLKMPQL